MHKLRNFHLLGILAAAAATAAFAQTEAPAAAQTNGATQGVIPELSGIWAHLTWPDVEPRRRALVRSGTWRAVAVSATCTNWWAIIPIRS
jgi:hypothetical protein